MKGINGVAIQKAFNIINDITDNGNLKKYKITLADFDEFYIRIRELYKTGKTETMLINVKNLFQKCGFKTKMSGVCWEVNGMI